MKGEIENASFCRLVRCLAGDGRTVTLGIGASRACHDEEIADV